MAARLPRRILDLIDEALALLGLWRAPSAQWRRVGRSRSRTRLPVGTRGVGAFHLAAVLSGWPSMCAGHAMQWFWFLIDPTIDATNYRAEQALRPAVVNRTLWGGNRTWCGGWVQGVLTSLLVTLTQRDHDALAWFSAARRELVPLSLPL